MNKIFKGYYIVGANSKEEAQNKKGMLLWSQKTPSFFVQFFNKLLLNIYWISEERVQTERGSNLNTSTELDVKNLPDKRKKK